MLEGLVSVIVPLILFSCCIVFWNVYHHRSRDLRNPRPLPPGSFGLPIIGETIQFLFRGRKFFEDRRKKYGMVYKTHLLGKPTVRVIGAENIKRLLTGENTVVKSDWPKSTQKLLGAGALGQAGGRTHAVRKKAIMRAFTCEALTSYVPAIQATVDHYIHLWCAKGKVMGYPELKTLMFDLSCKVLVGFDMSQQECVCYMKIFQTFLDNLFSLPFEVPGFGFYRGMQARAKLVSKIDECVDRRLSTAMDTGQNFTDALSLLINLQGEERLTLSEIRDVSLELLFAGHETTSSAACFLMMFLSKNPDVLRKVARELEENGLLSKSYGGDLDFVTVNRLVYVRSVVKEVLRISPPIGAGYRKALRTFDVGGYQIPKGWMVAYSIRDTHETAEVYSEPEIFNPDRWLDMTLEDPYKFIPFGGGKRSCVGRDFAQLVLKILTIELVRNCSWRMLNPSPKVKNFPVPCPTDNMPLEFSEIMDSWTA